jgi:RNA polymerase sigma factor (sigma-70 family)
MELTAEIELGREVYAGLGLNGPGALGRAAIQDCVMDSPDDELMTLSSVAEVEPTALMEMPTRDEPALCHESASEAQLLVAARDGDERAFVELTSRCVAQVRSRIFRIVRNRQDAEDALQDSLFRAHVHLHQFRGASSFSSWLHRIAINSAVMVLRKRKVFTVISSDRNEDDPSSWDALDVPDRSPNPEQVYSKRQSLECLSNAVERLPSSLRGVIEKVYDGECSVQEAADAMGISIAATKSRLVRARRMLRLALEEQLM